MKLISESHFPNIIELPGYKRDIVDSLLDSFYKSTSVLGILLGGSLASQKQHEKADIDLFCLINDQEKFEKYALKILGELYDVDIIIDQGYFPWTKKLYTVYFQSDISFSIDVCLIGASFAESFFWEPDGIILFDKKSLISKHRIIQESSPDYTKQPFLKNNPFSLSIIALKKIEKNLSRNHLFNALEQMNILRRYIMQIIRIHVLKETNFLGRVDRDIEECLPEKLRSQLAQTLASYDQADIAVKTIQLGAILMNYLSYTELTGERDFENWILRQIKYEQQSLARYA